MPLDRNASTVISLLMGAAFFSGCVEPRAPGTVSHEFVNPVEAPVAPANAKNIKISAPTAMFQDVKPILPLAEPVLPVGWEKSLKTPLKILVKVEIDERGRVVNVERSMLDFSPHTESSERCARAIREAVSQWRFEPALEIQTEPDRQGRPVITGETPVDSSVVVAFTLNANDGIRSQIVPR